MPAVVLVNNKVGRRSAAVVLNSNGKDCCCPCNCTSLPESYEVEITNIDFVCDDEIEENCGSSWGPCVLVPESPGTPFCAYATGACTSGNVRSTTEPGFTPVMCCNGDEWGLEVWLCCDAFDLEGYYNGCTTCELSGDGAADLYMRFTAPIDCENPNVPPATGWTLVQSSGLNSTPSVTLNPV